VGSSREQLEALLNLRLPRYREAVHHVNGERPPDVVASEILEIWSD
jgi:hypothetical protein